MSLSFGQFQGLVFAVVGVIAFIIIYFITKIRTTGI